MEDTTWMSWSAFILSLLGTVYTAINHRRIRSTCCGKVAEASLDIENTSPAKNVAQA